MTRARNISNPQAVTIPLTVSANITSNGTLSVGNTTVSGTFTANATTITGNVSVTGNTTLTGTLISNAHTMTGNLSVTGNTTYTGTIFANGVVTFANTTANTLTLNANGNIKVANTLEVTGSLRMNRYEALYGNGSISNPFKGLEGATKYKKTHIASDGNYYIELNGTVYLLPFIMNDIDTGPYHPYLRERAWMKITSNVATLSSYSGSYSSYPSNASLSNTGVITMSYVQDNGCGTPPMTYSIVLPTGTSYRFVRQIMYRANTIHQCLSLHNSTSYNTSTLERNGSGNTLRGLSIKGHASNTNAFVIGGSYTGQSINPNSEGGGPELALCTWGGTAGSIYTENGNSAPTTSAFTYRATCIWWASTIADDYLGLSLNCAAETSVLQTGTTHEYWISA